MADNNSDLHTKYKELPVKLSPLPETKPTTNTNLSTSSKVSEIFKLGQILDVVTLNQSQNGKINLRLGDTTLNASTSIPLKRDTQLSLRVEQLNPSLLLKPVATSSPALTTPAFNNAMLQFLPKQISISTLLASLASKENTIATSTKMAEVLAAIKLVNRSTENRKSIITANGLKHAITKSGLFFEASKQNSRLDNHDLKLQLLKLLRVLVESKPHSQGLNKSSTMNKETIPPLRGAPPGGLAASKFTPDSDVLLSNEIPKLIKQTQSALARIALLQIATAENFSDGQNLWQIEIPVRHDTSIEHLAINIEKENKKKESDSQAWLLNIALDLPRLGSLNLHIRINKKNISSTFWSDSDDVLEKIKQNLQQLRSSLKHHGLNIDSLKCQKGFPASNSRYEHAAIVDYRI